jgi:hypothetical protein
MANCNNGVAETMSD